MFMHVAESVVNWIAWRDQLARCRDQHHVESEVRWAVSDMSECLLSDGLALAWLYRAIGVWLQPWGQLWRYLGKDRLLHCVRSRHPWMTPICTCLDNVTGQVSGPSPPLYYIVDRATEGMWLLYNTTLYEIRPCEFHMWITWAYSIYACI